MVTCSGHAVVISYQFSPLRIVIFDEGCGVEGQVFPQPVHVVGLAHRLHAHERTEVQEGLEMALKAVAS